MNISSIIVLLIIAFLIVLALRKIFNKDGECTGVCQSCHRNCCREVK